MGVYFDYTEKLINKIMYFILYLEIIVILRLALISTTRKR